MGFTRKLEEMLAYNVGEYKVEAFESLWKAVGKEALVDHPREIVDLFNKLGNNAMEDGWYLGRLSAAHDCAIGIGLGFGLTLLAVKFGPVIRKKVMFLKLKKETEEKCK